MPPPAPVYKRTVFIFALALVLVLSLSLPIYPQTRVYVAIERDKISNVSVDKSLIPIVVRIFPTSRRIGAYTIEISISKASVPVFSDKIGSVPEGEYSFVWIDLGFPEEGIYHIEVRLLSDSIEKDTYSLDIKIEG